MAQLPSDAVWGRTGTEWGDYAGATPDPRRRNLVWGSNQLNGPELEDSLLGEVNPFFPHWRTRNFALVRRHGK